MIRKVDFFIIGFPKSGTTAMSYYLRKHPDVFITTPKEPGFFSKDFPGLQFVTKISEYEALHQFAPKNSLIGEATPHYIYSLEALNAIRTYNPDAKIVVMVRNPVDMLRSYHQQLLYSCFENQKDLNSAWRLQKARSNGDFLPKNCREKALLQYKNIISVGEHLRNVTKLFSNENLLVISFENFRSDTNKTFKTLLSFLGRSHIDLESFEKINSAKVARYPWLNILLHSPPSFAINFVRRLSGTKFQKYLINLHGVVGKLNSSNERVDCKIDEELRHELFEILVLQVEILSEITGGNFEDWLNGNNDLLA